MIVESKRCGEGVPELALEFVKTFPHGKADYCWLCYDKNNEVARKLYLSIEFQEIGEQDGDINAVIKLYSTVNCTEKQKNASAKFRRKKKTST